jgi:hypothetical protein
MLNSFINFFDCLNFYRKLVRQQLLVGVESGSRLAWVFEPPLESEVCAFAAETTITRKTKF